MKKRGNTMSNGEEAYSIDFASTFEYRRPVLEAMIPGRWQMASEGEGIKLDIPLALFSKHERHIIEFARNPYCLAENVFSGLDRSMAELLAKAIHELFGPSGAIYGQ